MEECRAGVHSMVILYPFAGESAILPVYTKHTEGSCSFFYHEL